MESKSKGEAAHLDASAKIGRGRGGDDGSDDGAALRADGGWRSAAASAPGLARPRGTAGPPPGAPSVGRRGTRAGRGASCTRGASTRTPRRSPRTRAAAPRPRRGRGRRSQTPAATATRRGASCGATRRARTARRATRGRTARARCPSPRPIACPARTPCQRAAEGAGAAAPNKGTTPTRTAARGARDGVHEESWPVRGHGVAGVTTSREEVLLKSCSTMCRSATAQLSRGLRSVVRRRRGQDGSIRRSVWVRQEHDGAAGVPPLRRRGRQCTRRRHRYQRSQASVAAPVDGRRRPGDCTL